MPLFPAPQSHSARRGWKQRWKLGLAGLGLLTLTFGAGAAWAVYTLRPDLLSGDLLSGGIPLLGETDSTVEPIEVAALPELSNEEYAQRFRQAWGSYGSGDWSGALSQLEGLESGIPVLADQILMMRAVAAEGLGTATTATQIWEQLVSDYPNSPMVARALQGLGRTDQLRSQWPDHPVTGDLLRQQLAQNPQDWSLVRDLAQHHPSSEGLAAHLTRWTQAAEQGQTQLTEQDWQVIADGYWTQREYGRASRAYGRAPINAQNLYRRGRSHHISRENTPAVESYRALLQAFPDSEDGILGRRRWAELADSQTAIEVLKPLADRSLPASAEALASLVRIYNQLNSPQTAQDLQEALWTRFPTSDAAATLAWERAWALAEAGNLNDAIAIAQRVGFGQKDSEMGSQLAYWAGKWRARQGDAQGATQVYRQVLNQFPHTYYGWRAAVQLGLPVGDFSVGRMPVNVSFTPARQPLPAVTEATQLLHMIGIPQAAWERWQWESYGIEEMSVEESFATGILRNAAGDHLRGINQVAAFRFDTDPVAQSLRQRQDFWQAVYPLHFHTSADNRHDQDPLSGRGIAQWTAQFNLNPLVMASLLRQESRFEPQIESWAGAVGLSQVMPATGAWIAQQVGLASYDLKNPADNLYLGAWYLDYTHRTYDNNTMLALASYNGGPGNVGSWIQRYGLTDPDLFVEQIPFPETRGYVKSVLGNYWNYWQLYTPEGEALISQLPR
ncbi:MAG: transglycosylase SLT domain-containing protein [Cyanophyceae cyanobacterium]